MHGDRLSLLALTIAWKKAFVSSTVSRPNNSARRTPRSKVILCPMALGQLSCALFPRLLRSDILRSRRRQCTEPLQQIRRGLLDARVHEAIAIVGQSPAPAGRPRADHPRA